MIRLWVCVVRRQVFVGGESQRCRHSETCETCDGTGKTVFILEDGGETAPEPCRKCNGTGQVSECGEMELIGGEPLEWCRTHGSALPQPKGEPWRCHWAAWREQASVYFDEDGIRTVVVIDDCQFESQVRVGP